MITPLVIKKYISHPSDQQKILGLGELGDETALQKDMLAIIRNYNFYENNMKGLWKSLSVGVNGLDTQVSMFWKEQPQIDFLFSSQDDGKVKENEQSTNYLDGSNLGQPTMHQESDLFSLNKAGKKIFKEGNERNKKLRRKIIYLTLQFIATLFDIKLAYLIFISYFCNFI